MMEKVRKTVLVSVINRRRDMDILLNEKWYRIPAAKMPARHFDWISFYQTSALGREGKLIKYYAQVEKCRRLLRRELFPDEKSHPKYEAEYCKFIFSDIKELSRPVFNKTRMRVNFGFTTLPRLMRFRNLHSLFGVRPLEAIFKKALRKNDIPFIHEYPIRTHGRIRYRLDIAIFCRKGLIDIECDQPKYHSGRRYAYDLRRNRFLRRRGWTVLRFSDEDILFNMGRCIDVLGGAIVESGGLW